MIPIPILGIGLLIGGALLLKRRGTTGAGPLTEEPDQSATEAEAVQAAKDAVDAASAGAKQGDVPATAEAVDKAAEAASAAAGTNAQQVVDALAKQAEDLLKQAAAAAGQKPPATSPGQPPLPSEKTEPTVVVNGQKPPPSVPTATFPTLPTSLEDAAAKLPIPVPIVTPGVTPPLAKEETTAEADPNGTVALARLLLDTETRPNWRDAQQGAVSTWQARVGLKADGKFGPGSALKMGQEVGVLPLIRFWPLGFPTKQAALQKYRDDVSTLAANLNSQGKREHAAALNVSAQREDARAFGNPKAAPVTAGERLAALEQLTRKVA